MPTIDDIVVQVGELKVLELADLVKKLEEKFGVSAQAPVMAVAGGAAGGAAAEEAQDEFDVILASAGDKKIQVLKVVRELTGLGLKEAKGVVDSAPKPVLEKVDKAKAEDAKKKLEAEGAKVEIK